MQILKTLKTYRPDIVGVNTFYSYRTKIWEVSGFDDEGYMLSWASGVSQEEALANLLERIRTPESKL